MTTLPDEIWSDILDYVDPLDVVSSQRVSHRLLKLARDSSLWRNKVFERAPSASQFHASKPNAASDLAGALSSLSLGGPAPDRPVEAGGQTAAAYSTARSRASRRAKAVLEWDSACPSEKIDWYSEYVARYASLSTTWAENSAPEFEVRGMALFGQAEKVIGSLEDGSLGIWDIQHTQSGRRKLVQVGKSRQGLLFEDMYSLGESSSSIKSKTLGATVENISIDSKRGKIFAAVEDTLNEVDLERMEVVSQNKFAWHITALSQEGNMDCELTVGTSFSLHIHDPRVPFLDSTDNTQRLDGGDESKIAFLANWTKGFGLNKQNNELGSLNQPYYDGGNCTNKIETYARLQPGPQSILHRGEHEIVIAGRMPSILFYDRRSFPRVCNAIHSGARLSAITTLPVPPPGSNVRKESDSTLIACGEYGGRGSLEIYELPWLNKRTSFGTANRQADEQEWPSSFYEPFSFKNRQEASSSKLLAVATQGTRIVFSDSEGSLKWVERDGHGLARRWNINAFQMSERGASVSGDKVVRKMIVLPEQQTDRGARGDGDLLVWTGEKIGIVTTKPKPWDNHDDLVQAFERGMDLNDRERQERDREMEYSTMMRQALERQADERRWMSRFGVRRW